MMNQTRRETINSTAFKAVAEVAEVRDALFDSYTDDDYTLEYRLSKLRGQTMSLASVVEKLSLSLQAMVEEQADQQQEAAAAGAEWEEEPEFHGEFVYFDEDADLGVPEEAPELLLSEMNAIKAFAREKLTQYRADFPDQTGFRTRYSSQICLHFQKKFPDGNVYEFEAMKVTGDGECIGDFVFCFYL